MSGSNEIPVLRNFVFNSPRRIVFGLNTVDEAANELEIKDGKVLIVTDEGIKKAGIVDKAVSILEKSDLALEVYDGVKPDPNLEVAEEVAEITVKGKFDAVIGLGGGSSLDTSKVASFCVNNPGKIEKYLGRGLIKRRGLPLVCIPTTSGTGSEVTSVAVFSVGEIKRFFSSPHLCPDKAIVDPNLTVSLPPRTTAGSGLDALSHAVEGIISLNSTPLSRAIGLRAINLITENLRKAYYNGKNIEARYNMALASTMAGLSFNDSGVVHGHSIAQTFSPMFDVPHGASCAMTLPHIMNFYKPASPEKLAMIAEAMGVETWGISEMEAAEEAIIMVHELNHDLEIPTLSDFGAESKHLPELAEKCVKFWVRENSPRTLTEKSALEILENMLT